MYSLLIILFVFIISIKANPQYVKIEKVIDSNLFELKDKSRIKLAGIDMPRIDNPDYFLSKTAKEAVKYTEERLTKKYLRMEVISETDELRIVYLIEEYPFGDINQNVKLLEQGFGRFINNIDSSDLELFGKAENTAKKQKNGIWKVVYYLTNDTLDREYSETEKNNSRVIDSLNYVYQNLTKPRFTHIIGELALSPVAGLAAGFATGFISVAVSGVSGFGAIVPAYIGGYIGYLFGSSFVIYAFADGTTKDVDLGSTIIISALGGGIGIALYADNKSHDDWRGLMPFILPVISSVIYANWIAPDRLVPATLSKYTSQEKKHFTAADIYNNTKVFELNVLKIYF